MLWIKIINVRLQVKNLFLKKNSNYKNYHRNKRINCVILNTSINSISIIKTVITTYYIQYARKDDVKGHLIYIYTYATKYFHLILCLHSFNSSYSTKNKETCNWIHVYVSLWCLIIDVGYYHNFKIHCVKVICRYF